LFSVLAACGKKIAWPRSLAVVLGSLLLHREPLMLAKELRGALARLKDSASALEFPIKISTRGFQRCPTKVPTPNFTRLGRLRNRRI